MNFKLIVGTGAILVIGAVAYLAFSGTGAPLPMQQACTMEAKLCPDGSAVGRTGPHCEFAACPAATSTPPATETSAVLQAAIGQKVTGAGVSLTPLAIVSDSRCPADVQCIWAGTVEVKVRIESGMGTSDMTLKLGVPATTEAETITLTDVGPAKSSGTEIPASSYRFTFKVSKRATGGNILPYVSGIEGSVFLGPTCPVVRNPPDPQCADKPYQTSITVSRTSSPVQVFATAQSAADGTFKISLPPGSYIVNAKGGAMLPRCAQTSATVSASGYTQIAVSCDTGIR